MQLLSALLFDDAFVLPEPVGHATQPLAPAAAL
jgi:hypothetical protein